MRTYLRGKITLLFMTCAVLLAIPAIALADIVHDQVNNIDSNANETINVVQDTTTTVKFWVERVNPAGGPGGDGDGGCNIDNSEQLYLKLNSDTPAVANALAGQGNVTELTQSGVKGLYIGPFAKTALTADGCDDPLTTGTREGEQSAVIKGLSTGSASFSLTVPASGATATDANNATVQLNTTGTGTYDVTTDATTTGSGATAVTRFFTVNVVPPPDTSAPTDASIKIDDDAAWTNNANGNVTVDLSATDTVGVTSYKLAETQAGLATATAQSVSPAEANFSRSNVPFTLTGTEGASKAVWLRVCDAQNNCSDASDTIGWDKTAPTITNLGPTTSPNGAGWYNADVTNRFKANDSLSGLNSACVTSFPLSAGDNVQSKTTSGEGTAVKVTSDSCTDVAGNSATGIDSATFQIDKSGPTITDLEATTSPNAAGWYKTDVINRFKASDSLSGLNAACVTAFPAAGTDNIQSKTTSGEGTNIKVTSDSCADVAGNSTSGVDSATFKVDKTAPAVSFDANASAFSGNPTFDFGDVPTKPTCSATDTGGSGVLTPPGCVVDGYGTAVNSYTLTAKAKDIAGNEGAATPLTYTVDPWDATGFYSPVGTDHSVFIQPPDTLPTVNDTGYWNTIKGGSTVPLKFNLFVGDTEKTTTSGIAFQAQKLSKCESDGTAVGDPVDFTTTETTSLRYSGTPGVDGQFIQNWKTSKVTAETCYRTTVTFADGSSIYAFFKLLK